MEIILSQYELLTRICNYLDHISLYHTSNLNRQTMHSVKKPPLNKWDKTFITISNMKNATIGNNSVIVESMGILVKPVFNPRKKWVSLIIQSIEFQSICKIVPICPLNTKNFSIFFTLVLISSQLTTSGRPEFWLRGDTFLYKQKFSTSYLRFTDILHPALYVVSDAKRNFGADLNYLMFRKEYGTMYNHIEINNYLRNFKVSHTLDTYWESDGYGVNFIKVNNVVTQYQGPPTESIVTIIDDEFAITLCLYDIRCFHINSNHTFSFRAYFDNSLVNEITNYSNWSFRNLETLGIGNGYVGFVIAKSTISKIIIFNIIKKTCQVLSLHVDKIYVVDRGIIKYTTKDSTVLTTLDLNSSV